MGLQQFGVIPFEIRTLKKPHTEKRRTRRIIKYKAIVVTEAPSVHRATELVCQFYWQFIYKTFIPKYLARICTLHLRRSLCRRHLRNIVRYLRLSVTPCAYYIRLLVYHSIFRMSLLYVVGLLYHSKFLKNFLFYCRADWLSL